MIYVQVLICAHFEEKILSFLQLCKSCPLYKYCDKKKYLFIESYTLFFLNLVGVLLVEDTVDIDQNEVPGDVVDKPGGRLGVTINRIQDRRDIVIR